ncbi:MAG: protease complex subunit PrcB family protein, partial [Phycisphaerae bacterium]
MIRKTTVGAVWACLLTAGCSLETLRPIETVQDGQELPILRDQAGTFSTFQRPARLVVRDSSTAAQLPLNLGPVDFEWQMVLVAAMGPTPTDQYGITIRRAWRDGNQVRVQVEMRYPPPGAPLRSSPASPYHAVVVQKCDLNVRGFDAVIRPESVSRD